MRSTPYRLVQANVALVVFALAPLAAADESQFAEQEQFFENKVRPILVQRCFECHSEEKQQGDLRLDSRDFVLKGNDSGPALVPGEPEESRLVQVIRYSDGDTQMPPPGKLPEEEIRILTEWVRHGAFWPNSAATGTPAHDPLPRTADGRIDFIRAAAEHWAYRPVQQPGSPQVRDNDACRTTIDRFVQSRLEERGLTLSPPADRRTLIRRAYVDLLGVPPTYAEVAAFAADETPDAWERLIDRLLASPLYGQRWGRHWLDVARYADTKGYVFTENRFYPYAYTYRDYVIDAFNADKPYDRFVVEQLAADQLGLRSNDPALAALGFLTVGRRFLNSQPDIMDDRIDVVTRGLMGMTLACARCHDHKYDPLPTADYYALYGVFASSYEPDELPLVGDIVETAEYLAYQAELDKRRQAVEDYKTKTRSDLLRQLQERAADYLLAVASDERQVPAGVEVKYEHGNPREKLTGLWKSLLERRARGSDDAVFQAWRALAGAPADQFAERLAKVLQESDPQQAGPRVNPLVLGALRDSPPQNVVELARAYGRVLKQADQQWQELLKQGGEPAPARLADDSAEELRQVLHGPGSITDVPPSSGGRRDPLFERDHRDKIKELERKVGEWEASSQGAPPRAMVLLDRDEPTEPVVFQRGDPNRPGDRVPRRFPQVLSVAGTLRVPSAERDLADVPSDGTRSVPATLTGDGTFRKGSGRLELAREIASADNPLTARVIVNRVWMHHFGAALVNTASDFGARSDPPTHPELLDHLAARFMAGGWSLKHLHREMLLSAVYRQASGDQPDCREQDPENRLLWRMNRRRVEFEVMRDALLAVAGRLDPSLRGRPVDIEKSPFSNRRTVYAQIDRNNLPGLLRTFDFPTPDTSAPERPRTTVPQQALYGMNAPFVQEVAADVARSVAALSVSSSEPPAVLLFRRVLGRDPQESERTLVAEYLAQHPDGLRDVAQALLLANEFWFVD